MKILFLLFIIVLTSCSLSKKSSPLHIKHGTIEQEEFFRKIHFENKAGLPIIKVNVNGIEANFLFDTGAPNVISIELASKLNLVTVLTDYVRDSGGKREIQDYVMIDNITIDSIHFLNTGAIVSDLSKTEVTDCFNIDGIIGANLMRKAFWKVNYDEQSIDFSNELSNLLSATDWDTIDFTPNSSGTPIIDLKLNNRKIARIAFDTGSNGGIEVSKKVLYALESEKLVMGKTYLEGSRSHGVHGLSVIDTVHYANIKKFSLGNLVCLNELIMFGNQQNLLGSGFLSKYTFILDWVNEQILIERTNNSSNEKLETFGFITYQMDNSIFVGSIFRDCTAREKLKIGDEILEINGENYQDISDDYLCELFMSRKLHFTDLRLLELKIKRDDELLNIKLTKQALFK